MYVCRSVCLYVVMYSGLVLFSCFVRSSFMYLCISVVRYVFLSFVTDGGRPLFISLVSYSVR